MENPHGRSKAKRRKICEAVKRMLASGEWKPGDRFDSERKLAERMNVQRLTARRAIKVLCEEGVLVQRPKSGTFVATEVDRARVQSTTGTDLEASFAPTTNLLAPRMDTVIRFANDDCLPEQTMAWGRLFDAFHATCSNIRVELVKINPESDVPDYDCAILRPHDLHHPRIRSQGRVIPDELGRMSVNDGILSETLMRKIDLFCRRRDGRFAVPVLLTFPVNVVNRSAFESVGGPLPPSRRPWREFRDWLDALKAVGVADRICVFSHSPLNHFVRQDRNVLNDERVSLDSPEVMEFCRFWKRLWVETAFHSMYGFAMAAELELFKNGRILVHEMFLNLVPHVMRSVNCAMRLNSLSPNGASGVLPRFLVFGPDRGKMFELLEFVQFLVSPTAQRVVAETGLGVPYHLGESGIEAYCRFHPLDSEEMKTELTEASAFYENVFFTRDFQVKIINAELLDYFQGRSELERMIDNVGRRTERLSRLLG